MSIFTSSTGGGLFSTRRDDPDVELSLPLYSSADNRSSGFLAAASSNLPTSRSASPRPTDRIPRPSTPPALFSPPPLAGRLRRVCRQSWQTILVVMLLLYTFYTFLRPSTIQIDAADAVAEYDGGPPKSKITHLVMVTGHAIWMGGPTLGDDEKEWTLLSYQKGLAKTFKQHIQKGVDIAQADEGSLLVFTGGETRRFAGPSSEAQSYWSLAYLSKLIPPESSLFNRSTTEEFARDSYENLLFSICRFHEYTSNYPSKITVVGFEFKRERFETVHRHAIRYPHEQFTYIGLDNTDDQEQLAHFQKGEKEGTLAQFRADPHGCVDAGLVSKKKERNPFRTRHGYEFTSHELRELLRWCTQSGSFKDGKARLYTGALPWSRGS